MSSYPVYSSIASVGVVLLVLILAIRRYTPDTYANSKLKLFMDVLAGMAVVMVAVQVVLTAQQTSQQKQSDQIAKTEQAISEEWLGPNNRFAQDAKVIPQFVGSLYENNPELHKACTEGKVDECSRLYEEQSTALDVMQRVENFITLRAYDQTGDIVWIANFLQWVASARLRYLWGLMKHNYKTSTQKLFDLLIEYSDKFKPKSSQDFMKAADMLSKDPRFADAVS